MPEYVRVCDKETGHHLSIFRNQYDLNPDAWQLLKQPATFADGTPRPAKHKTTIDEKSAAKNGPKAETEKEKS